MAGDVRMKRFFVWMIVFCVLGCVGAWAQGDGDAAWMKVAKYGVFVHFLGGGDGWNATVDSFDVGLFTEQMVEAGAGYVVFTLGQNSGYYCSPNAVYEKYCDYEAGSRCAKRDLPMELADALGKHGIRLMLYLPSRAPQLDREAMGRLSDVPQDKPAPQAFTKKWSAVIREWSLRYGPKVSGWWFDGSYNTKGWDDLSQANHWNTWAAACRAGNPDSILAFNPGTRIDKAFGALCAQQDYTAGERNEFTITPEQRPAPAGVQWHLLAHLGSKWSFADGPQLSDEAMIAYIKTVHAQGGVVSMDVRVEDNGRVYEGHLRQLKALKEAIRD
jgi:hypothetical protein